MYLYRYKNYPLRQPLQPLQFEVNSKTTSERWGKNIQMPSLCNYKPPFQQLTLEVSEQNMESVDFSAEKTKKCSREQATQTEYDVCKLSLSIYLIFFILVV